MLTISAEITGIEYTPFLCKNLNSFNFNKIDEALSKNASFLLNVGKGQVAVSWWVSPKRTRSYPYVRVYDTLGFAGKKITIIPIMKDEGKEGDRDFLQWDTVSLMSLLGVYVIIAYYKEASKSTRYRHKITNQRFDISYIKQQIKKLLSYQSGALHWNLSQIDNIGSIAKKALECYNKISKDLKVEMHSKDSAQKRIGELIKGKARFMALSRDLAKKAQKRETITTQPKEKVDGTKARITIKNYLGGEYYFTADEIKIKGNDIYLIEAKHTSSANIPSIGDVKDGLLKMILFTNLKNVKIDDKSYNVIPILKLTTRDSLLFRSLTDFQKKFIEDLKKEAKANNFRVLFNKKFI
ncbi:MAG: hypothetical protein J7K26_00615 [Candidatus Aenigmarchaeota archaeon]|nr:hypothetical protein [Candidatus Aenigmarchaeota archaeon]